MTPTRWLYALCFAIGIILAALGIDLPLWFILLPFAIYGAIVLLEDHLAHR